jgi:hypothetical protein
MSFQEIIDYLNQNFVNNSPHKLIKIKDVSELLTQVIEIVNLYGTQLKILDNEIKNLKFDIYNNVTNISCF